MIRPLLKVLTTMFVLVVIVLLTATVAFPAYNDFEEQPGEMDIYKEEVKEVKEDDEQVKEDDEEVKEEVKESDEEVKEGVKEDDEEVKEGVKEDDEEEINSADPDEEKIANEGKEMNKDTIQEDQDFQLTWNKESTKNYVSFSAGDNQSIIPTMLPPITEFTLSMWINDTGSKTQTAYLSYYTSENADLLFGINKDMPVYYLYIDGSGTDCKPTHPYVRDQYHHLLVTWTNNGGHVNMYEDGKRLSCSPLAIKTGYVIPTGFKQNMVLGQRHNTNNPNGFMTGSEFLGSLAYVNLYNWYTADTTNAVRAMMEERRLDGNLLAWELSTLTIHGDIDLFTAKVE